MEEALNRASGGLTAIDRLEQDTQRIETNLAVLIPGRCHESQATKLEYLYCVSGVHETRIPCGQEGPEGPDSLVCPGTAFGEAGHDLQQQLVTWTLCMGKE